MLTLQVNDHALEKELSEILHQKFNNNSEAMLQALVKLYQSQLNRMQYSGILKWDEDGLAYQKEIRRDWQ